MILATVLAQSGPDSPTNQWLNENPLVLGLIFLVLGGVLLAVGVQQWRSGVAQDKWGNEYSGDYAQFLSIIRIVIGAICCGFAIYKMVVG